MVHDEQLRADELNPEFIRILNTYIFKTPQRSLKA